MHCHSEARAFISAATGRAVTPFLPRSSSSSFPPLGLEDTWRISAQRSAPSDIRKRAADDPFSQEVENVSCPPIQAAKAKKKAKGRRKNARKESLQARRWRRCVSDVICGCHGDAIDWPTRRQTSRESRRHSDYCRSLSHTLSRARHPDIGYPAALAFFFLSPTHCSTVYIYIYILAWREREGRSRASAERATRRRRRCVCVWCSPSLLSLFVCDRDPAGRFSLLNWRLMARLLPTPLMLDTCLSPMALSLTLRWLFVY